MEVMTVHATKGMKVKIAPILTNVRQNVTTVMAVTILREISAAFATLGSRTQLNLALVRTQVQLNTNREIFWF